jgi:hypothetical protein
VTSAPTYPHWLAELAAASPEALALAMLEADPHAWRLDRATQLAAVSDALADGTTAARALRARFPDFSPQAITDALGVPIETIDDDPMIGPLWRFAEYRERPARILLYRRGLAPLDRVVNGDLGERLLGQATPRDVFTAHELFHHLEAVSTDRPVAQRYRPTLFRIGGWHWRTGIAALSEIAAGGFAQELLGLPCHPRVLDLVAREAVSRNASAGRMASTAGQADLSRARLCPYNEAMSKQGGRNPE